KRSTGTRILRITSTIPACNHVAIRPHDLRRRDIVLSRPPNTTMRRIRSLITAIATLVCASWIVHSYRTSVLNAEFLVYGATTGGPTPPPQLPPPPSDAARIRGKVLDTKTGAPVRDAQVIVRPSRSDGMSGFAISDARGAFEIRVAPGSHY